jgi:hypothetical protein
MGRVAPPATVRLLDRDRRKADAQEHEAAIPKQDQTIAGDIFISVEMSRSKWVVRPLVDASLQAAQPRDGGWRPKLGGLGREDSWSASKRVLSVYNITSVPECI